MASQWVCGGDSPDLHLMSRTFIRQAATELHGEGVYERLGFLAGLARSWLAPGVKVTAGPGKKIRGFELQTEATHDGPPARSADEACSDVALRVPCPCPPLRLIIVFHDRH